MGRWVAYIRSGLSFVCTALGQKLHRRQPGELGECARVCWELRPRGVNTDTITQGATGCDWDDGARWREGGRSPLGRARACWVQMVATKGRVILAILRLAKKQNTYSQSARSQHAGSVFPAALASRERLFCCGVAAILCSPGTLQDVCLRPRVRAVFYTQRTALSSPRCRLQDTNTPPQATIYGACSQSK